MSGNFNMDDYVDVAERISLFAGKYPEGSLQSSLEPIENPDGVIVGWLCEASAYRTADDLRPGMGHAFEPVPGKTPFTKDSEAMNAETSAWGRAIIALGFPTKKIASANEVRARKGSAAGDGNSAQAEASKAESAAATRKASKAKLDRIEKMLPRLAELRGTDVHSVHDALVTDLGKPFAELSPLEADELLEKMLRWQTSLEAQPEPVPFV